MCSRCLSAGAYVCACVHSRLAVRQLLVFSFHVDVYSFLFTWARRWLGSRVVSVLDSGAEGPGFKSQSRRCRVTVIGKLFTSVVPLFTKQRNW